VNRLSHDVSSARVCPAHARSHHQWSWDASRSTRHVAVRGLAWVGVEGWRPPHAMSTGDAPLVLDLQTSRLAPQLPEVVQLGATNLRCTSPPQSANARRLNPHVQCARCLHRLCSATPPRSSATTRRCDGRGIAKPVLGVLCASSCTEPRTWHPNPASGSRLDLFACGVEPCGPIAHLGRACADHRLEGAQRRV
jgi:hypothetical protein